MKALRALVPGRKHEPFLSLGSTRRYGRLKRPAASLCSATLKKMTHQNPDAPRRMRLVMGVTLLLGVMAAELALSARQQSQIFD